MQLGKYDIVFKTYGVFQSKVNNIKKRIFFK